MLMVSMLCPPKSHPSHPPSAILEGVTLCLMIIHSHLSLAVPSEQLCGGYTGIHVCTAVRFKKGYREFRVCNFLPV